MDTPASESVVVEVGDQFRRYAEAACVRLAARYPDLGVTVDEDGIRISGRVLNYPLLRKEALHTLYREKIYEETLSMRRSLIEALTVR